MSGVCGDRVARRGGRAGRAIDEGGGEISGETKEQRGLLWFYPSGVLPHRTGCSSCEEEKGKCSEEDVGVVMVEAHKSTIRAKGWGRSIFCFYYRL